VNFEVRKNFIIFDEEGFKYFRPPLVSKTNLEKDIITTSHRGKCPYRKSSLEILCEYRISPRRNLINACRSKILRCKAQHIIRENPFLRMISLFSLAFFIKKKFFNLIQDFATAKFLNLLKQLSMFSNH
jgi:hypothetical protein